jgi:ribonucleoside-diphosphate reductase alpha chain
MAKSIPDYIFRWLAMQFIPGFREANAPQREPSSHKQQSEGDAEEPGSSPAAAVQAVQDVLAAHNVPQTAVADAAAAAVKAPQRKNLNGSANGHANGNGNGKHAVQLMLDSSVFPHALSVADEGPSVRSQQFSTFQSDAPACDNCGAITVRNGNCYLCHNCGASMGCS